MNIQRYPPTQNRSLRAWSAADEYVLKKINELDLPTKKITLTNDRFGYLSCHLCSSDLQIVIDRKSQRTSIEKNLSRNNLKINQSQWISPLNQLPVKTEAGVIGIPKSMDLFKLYLQQIHKGLVDDGIVICGFMTRHFTPQILDIADEYFEDVQQSLAWKKSRLLILKQKKSTTYAEVLNTLPYTFKNGMTENITQYYGVFSSENIDYATQFLIEHLELQDSEDVIMDLAAGSGVIARAMQLQKPNAELHLVEDSFLAVESSKHNLDPHHITFHWLDTLDCFEQTAFDFVVSNPPFHFGHENNIEVTIRLFREVKKVLRKGGRFMCVANRHLNYQTQLDKIFNGVTITAENEKFLVYECNKL